MDKLDGQVNKWIDVMVVKCVVQISLIFVHTLNDGKEKKAAGKICCQKVVIQWKRKNKKEKKNKKRKE